MIGRGGGGWTAGDAGGSAGAGLDGHTGDKKMMIVVAVAVAVMMRTRVMAISMTMAMVIAAKCNWWR